MSIKNFSFMCQGFSWSLKLSFDAYMYKLLEYQPCAVKGWGCISFLEHCLILLYMEFRLYMYHFFVYSIRQVVVGIKWQLAQLYLFSNVSRM